jgi:predicted small lipoprotein YifL
MKTWLKVLVAVAAFGALAACKKGETLPDSSTAEAVGAGAGGRATTS